jgi:hypothetical protein
MLRGALIGIALAAPLLPATLVLPAAPADFHVAPRGDDETGTGAADRPWASLAHALEEIARRIGAGLAGEARIVLEDGIYMLSAPLVIGPRHVPAGGTLTIEAASGARPLVSGGRRIAGWSAREDGTLVARVPEELGGRPFRELFVGGVRRPRARWPNAGYLRIRAAFPDKRSGFTFAPGDIPAAVEGGSELVFLHDWSVTRVTVRSIDHAAGRLTAAHAIGSSSKHFEIDNFEPHPRYFLEDHAALLDAPGEWHLDRARGEVLYRPLDGESAATLEAVAPLLPALVIAGGAEGKTLRGVHFRGLAFSHAAWSLPEEGYAEGQAAFFDLRREGEARGRVMLESAIRFERAEDCSLADCRVAHLGLSGVLFGSRTRGCRLERCVIEDVSGNAVNLGEDTSRQVDGKPWWQAAREEIAADHVVSDCLITRAGQQFFGAVGIWVGLARGVRIAHNEIRDHPYTGISLGWIWNPTPSPAGGNVVEQNHIHHVMQVLSDGGGIYTLGRQPGTELKGNHIHDVPLNAGRAESNGMFLDEGSDEIIIRGNAIWGTERSPLRFHRAFAMRVEENILVVPSAETPALRYNSTDPATIAQKSNTVITTQEFAAARVQAIAAAAGPR